MNSRVKGFIAAAALVSMVGVPLTASAQAPAPGPAQQAPQAATASGELTRVDVAAKTLVVKASDGKDMTFSFTDDTKITGASSAAGLATMEGSQVTVRYTAQGAKQTATDIAISPKKQ